MKKLASSTNAMIVCTNVRCVTGDLARASKGVIGAIIRHCQETMTGHDVIFEFLKRITN